MSSITLPMYVRSTAGFKRGQEVVAISPYKASDGRATSNNTLLL